MTPLTAMLLTSLLVVLATMTALWLLSLALRERQHRRSVLGNGLHPRDVADARDHMPPATIGHAVVVARGVGDDLGLAAVTVFAVAKLRSRRGPPLSRDARASRPALLVGQPADRLSVQGVILWIVSMPIQAAMVAGPTNAVLVQSSGMPLGWLDVVGASVWLIGFLFESVGDFQMARFQADPANAGKVMDRGFWRLHSASELFRRLLRLVGFLPDRGWQPERPGRSSARC